MLVLILVFTCIVATQSASLFQSHPPLPPCGMYSDCSSPAYNFLPRVVSLSSCQASCQGDPQCSYYSYNYSVASHLYRHCFLHTQCSQGVGGVLDYSGWVSAPRVCREDLHNPLLIAALRTSYFRASK